MTIEAEALDAEGSVREYAAEARAAREAAAKARLAAQALATERDTLAKLLLPTRDPEYPPIVDSLKVTPGYETALGASLGDDLDAPAAPSAPVRSVIEVARADGALPNDVEPLSRYVEAPPELSRRLKQIGVVAPEDGPKLQRHLKPGQRLVSQSRRHCGAGTASSPPVTAPRRRRNASPSATGWPASRPGRSPRARRPNVSPKLSTPQRKLTRKPNCASGRYARAGATPRPGFRNCASN